MLSTYPDEELILARIKTIATPVHETIDDIQTLPRFTNGTLRPVVEVSFGVPIASPTNRSFAEEWAQPVESYVFVTAFGPNKQTVRAILGDLLRPGFLVGWSPSNNASGLWMGGGTEYTITDDLRPSVIAVRNTFRWAGNMHNQSGT